MKIKQNETKQNEMKRKQNEKKTKQKIKQNKKQKIFTLCEYFFMKQSHKYHMYPCTCMTIHAFVTHMYI